MLHADALRLGLGLLLVVAGLAAAAVHLRSRGGAESTLPWFGLFSFLYGVRLLARTDTFPLFFDAPPVRFLCPPEICVLDVRLSRSAAKAVTTRRAELA
jgi:hypothetical protein